MKKGCITVLFLLLIAALVLIFFGDDIINKGMELFYPKKYEDIVEREAAEFSLDENLVYAVIHAESKFDDDAKSHAGAVGLMQLTPETFEWINGKNPPHSETPDILDPGDNIHAGCALLRLLLDHYGGLDVALCAYNAGMGNVSGWLKNAEYSSDGRTLDTIPFGETAAYVKRVKENYAVYQRLYPAAAF